MHCYSYNNYCFNLAYILFDVLLLIVRFTFAVFMNIYQRKTFYNCYVLVTITQQHQIVRVVFRIVFKCICYCTTLHEVFLEERYIRCSYNELNDSRIEYQCKRVYYANDDVLSLAIYVDSNVIVLTNVTACVYSACVCTLHVRLYIIVLPYHTHVLASIYSRLFYSRLFYSSYFIFSCLQYQFNMVLLLVYCIQSFMNGCSVASDPLKFIKQLFRKNRYQVIF